MVTALLLRHYKNYGNVRFIPLIDDTDHMFTIYIGNNGVGKSAVLEALDLALNGSSHRAWNITQGQKKTEAFVCPIFLISKKSIASSKKRDIEAVSNYFWSDEPDKSAVVNSSSEIKSFIDYKNRIKGKYETTHYLVMVGISNDSPGAFFASFDGSVRKLLGKDDEERNKRANDLKAQIASLYSYLYIPVEESPTNLLQLQNETMQKLLNKDIQQEIERILNSRQEKANSSIVTQINKNLDAFINEVNNIISQVDPEYTFSAESGTKKKLTAKDIRAKIIEAFFPLRALKKGNRRVELLSSGEQRRAIIDVVYSTLMANKERKTERNIILAIDEPEISMHISNCFSQFSRLEELSQKGVQVIVTTHWYGYLPIAQNGYLHYLELKDCQTNIKSFSLYNLLEDRGRYPDDIEMKSMFDLASSLISYMRRNEQKKWIFCEGSDDKLYLQTMLKNYKDIHIVPLGGCTNVVKLYRILVGFITEKTEKAHPDGLFLIDTDKERLSVDNIVMYSSQKPPILLRRLQIVNENIKLLDPLKGGTYQQTEIEDCLNSEIYYKAVSQAITQFGDRSLKATFKHYEFVQDAPRSVLRGDNSCIRATDPKYIAKKQQIIDFVENDQNKKQIAVIYASLCNGKTAKHPLADLIAETLGLEKK